MITLDGGELAPESRYVWRARKPGHKLRLICFPYAGAGAANYADWAALLPPDIELVAVQLPGRQNRIADAPFRETGPLIAALSYALRPVLDVPFAFFGHSGGVIAAYELAQALRARGMRGPERLFLSAQPAPGAPAGVQRLHDLPDEEFRAEMLALGGIESELADDPDVMDVLLPLLRADFRLWEGYRPSPVPPLDCPITVLCGEDDHRAPLSSLDRWRARTTADFEIRIYPGGHFYFLPETAELVAFIGQRMLDSASNRRS